MTSYSKPKKLEQRSQRTSALNQLTCPKKEQHAPPSLLPGLPQSETTHDWEQRNQLRSPEKIRILSPAVVPMSADKGRGDSMNTVNFSQL